MLVSYTLSAFKIRTGYETMPVFASFEVADFCNLRCPQCPTGMRRNTPRNTREMDFALFKSIFNELRPALTHAIFYFQGEPLLAKNLAEMVRFAHQSRVYTSTSTNAQLLDEPTAKSLIEAGLDKIIVSIDGATQETYAQYRVGGTLHKAIRGVENLIKWKKELKSNTPLVEIQCLLLRTTENQIAQMQQLARQLQADRLVFKTAQFYNFQNGNPLMPENEKLSRYRKDKKGKYVIKSPLRNRCWRLWAGVVIAADGKILPCCYDKNADFVFGTFPENRFSAIWNGKKANNFRSCILQNRRQFEICRNCTQ